MIDFYGAPASLVPVEQRSTYEAQTGRTNTQELLDELERALVAPYLVDNRFTVADLNVASVVNLADVARFDQGARSVDESGDGRLTGSP